MALLSTLYPLLVPELPQCPTAIIQQALVEAARDLCRRSGVWEEDLATIATVADQEDYTLTSDYAYATFFQVIQVDVGTSEDWDFTVDYRSSVLTLDPAPSVDGDDIVCRVLYQPLRTATQLPDYIMNKYSQALIYRVLSRLKARRRTPWGDLEGAGYYNTLYLDEISDIMADDIVKGDGDLIMTVEHVL